MAAEINEDSKYQTLREHMVVEQIQRRGISDPRVLAAMRSVPRQEFVLKEQKEIAYQDRALPIGVNQTISQPYIVALIAQQSEIKENDRILEIGTGCGYQAAVLSKLAKQIYTIEIIESLGDRAKKLLESLGYNNITVKIADGFDGWKEKAPFDVIVLTAAPRRIPLPLMEQLTVGGRLVAPVGDSENQELVVIKKTKSGLKKKNIIPVRFVPMTGKARSS
ncbi:MAG: protein-L-isoaspartate(D-aspartate) O-methyltransferase [Bacteriovoracia bacterium]